jgi:DNA/RNA endonuclease G (NUC1)
MANAELEAAASSFYCNNIVPQNGEANNKENNQHIVNLNTSQTVNGNTQIINLF